MKNPRGLLFVLLLLAITASTGLNGALGLLAVGVLAIGTVLLWRPGLSPVFAFIFFYQWLQASTLIFRGDLVDATVAELAQFGGEVSQAITLSLLGLATLAVGMRVGLGNPRGWQPSVAVVDIADRPPVFWFWLYAAAFGMSLVTQILANSAPGLSQPLLALAGLKWAFFWILTLVAFNRGGIIRWLWLAFFLMELGLGLIGYFSTFKSVLFFSMFGILASKVRLTPVRILGLAGLGLLTLALAVGWTAIKTEQRRFLNQGDSSQRVTVSIQESLNSIIELGSDLDREALEEAAVLLAARVSYVDFFARVLEAVPEDVPHENGAIWGDAALRPFMPRMFFPDKTVIEDSDRTNYYTGLNVSGKDQSTSISLGYMAEAYIDFGAWLMMLPILALGWCYGRFYRWMVNYPYSRGVVGMGLATATLFPAAYFETSITKLFGGLVVSALVAWLLARTAVPFIHKVGDGKPARQNRPAK